MRSVVFEHGHWNGGKVRLEPLQTMRLRSGLQLAWAEFGDPTGDPVLHFHGHPGSRLEGRLAAEVAERLGVRLIVLDRPGMGHSEFDPDRQLTDWPDTITEFADHLGLDRFAVQGASGGGPYALVCARRIPDRLTACGVIAGLGPIHRLGVQGMMALNQLQFRVARRAPWLLRPMFWAVVGRHRRKMDDPEEFRSLVEKWSEGVSRKTGSRELGEAYVIETLEAFRQGSRGAAYDARLYTKPWGFRLKDIEMSKVFLWHGERDVNVPIEMARAVADAVPGLRARYLPGEDHMTVILGRLEEALGVMKDPSRTKDAF